MSMDNVNPGVPTLDQVLTNLSNQVTSQQDVLNRVVAQLSAPSNPPAMIPSASTATFSNPLLKAIERVKLPVYSGERDIEELDTWIFQLERYFEAFPYTSEEQRIDLAGMQLRGQAATWWRDAFKRGTGRRPGTWATFTQELMAMFMPINREQLSRDRSANARQRDKDSLSLSTPPTCGGCFSPYPPCQSPTRYTVTSLACARTCVKMWLWQYQPPSRMQRQLQPDLRRSLVPSAARTLQSTGSLDQSRATAMDRNQWSWELWDTTQGHHLGHRTITAVNVQVLTVPRSGATIVTRSDTSRGNALNRTSASRETARGVSRRHQHTNPC